MKIAVSVLLLAVSVLKIAENCCTARRLTKLLQHAHDFCFQPFLDNWSVAATAESEANDIANIADVDDALAHPAVYLTEIGYVQLWEHGEDILEYE